MSSVGREKPCCDRLEEMFSKEPYLFRRDEYGVVFLVCRKDGYTKEQTISFCPFCGTDISIKNTHRLKNVLSAHSEFLIRFTDGTEFQLKDCAPIDFSIYHRAGGYSGTVVAFAGTKKQMRLYKAGSRIDFYENDILSIRNGKVGEAVYEKKI